MVPYRLIDHIGVDVAVMIARSLERSFSMRFSCPAVLACLDAAGTDQAQERDRLLYGTAIPVGSIRVLQTRSTRSPRRATASDLKRCLFLMIDEAARSMEDEVVTDPVHLDMAMILDTGFPEVRGRVLAYADNRGLAQVVDRLSALRESHGHRFEPSEHLVRLARAGAQFYEDHPDA